MNVFISITRIYLCVTALHVTKSFHNVIAPLSQQRCETPDALILEIRGQEGTWGPVGFDLPPGYQILVLRSNLGSVPQSWVPSFIKSFSFNISNSKVTILIPMQDFSTFLSNVPFPLV